MPNLKSLFQWPGVIGVVLAIGMAVAITCLAYHTRHDPFPARTPTTVPTPK